MSLLEIPIASALFLLLFASSAIAFLRSRSAVAGGVVLLFGSVSLVFLARLLDVLFDASLPGPLEAVSIAGLLAQPILTLRLAAMFERVPRSIMVAALAGYVLTTVPVLVASSSIPVPLILATVAVYAVTAGTAAAYFFRASRRRIGSARQRLRIASVATVLMAVTLLVAGIGAALPAGSVITAALARYGVLLAAIGYAAAFLTPRWLRRIWQARTSFELSRRLLKASALADAETTWRTFVKLAATALGVGDAIVVVGDERSGGRVAAAVGALPTADLELGADAFKRLTRSASAVHQRSSAVLDDLLELRLPADRYVTMLCFDVPRGETAVIMLVGERRSLFSADDREMLELLGIEAGLLADRAAAMSEQSALADRLATTVEALEAASRAKSDFLASMSHELRTPLNAILGFSDLMGDEPESDGRRAVPAEWVEHVHVAGEHLLGLINDVLDLAKVEAGRLELRTEQIALDAAVSEALAGLRPLADQKRISLSSTIDVRELVVDRARLRQILYNLLSNAIKYTPPDGEVRVEARADADGARIAVVDTGVGIAPEDYERVFDEFTQVGDPEARQAGTGLGLALTRRLVEAHGGRVELDSAVGAGSTFTVVLPPGALAPADTADVGAEPAKLQPPARHRGLPPVLAATRGTAVLVVEDDEQAVALLRTYLEPTGYSVAAAPDGVAGISMARKLRPAAILLDVVLPGLDGWEVLRRLKADPELQDIPVLMITVVDERDVGMALGAVDYLIKPIERNALLEALRRHVPAVLTAQPRVLAVDDNAASRALVNAALAATGCEVVLASGGREAIHAASEGRFDLVICDLVMPDIDGFEVVAQLKAAAATRETPILILTGHTITAEDKARLNGKIVGICEKGSDAPERLRQWLARAAPAVAAPSAATG